MCFAEYACITIQEEPSVIDELLKRVTERTGLSPEQAKSAVDCVLGFLREKLPAPLASGLDSFIGDGESAEAGGEGGMAAKASAAIGSLFGTKN